MSYIKIQPVRADALSRCQIKCKRGELWDRWRRKEITELIVKRHDICKMKRKAHASNHTAQPLNSIYTTGTQKTWEGIHHHEKKVKYLITLLLILNAAGHKSVRCHCLSPCFQILHGQSPQRATEFGMKLNMCL